MIVLSAMLGSCAQQLGDSDAALALEDIAVMHADSRLKALTTMPRRLEIQFTVDGRSSRADVYLSAERTRAGIVLVPGVVPDGKNDPRLVALANTLARCGFAVLIPDMQGLRQFKVRKSDVREVADAFRYLVAQPSWAPQGRAGIAGFSYGAGPVVMAAMEADIRDQVHFIYTLGGYYDLHSMVTYFTTGYFRDPEIDSWQYRQPDPYIKWVFALSNIELLENAVARNKMRELAMNKDVLSGNRYPQITGIGSDARALYELLTNTDRARVGELLARLPARIQHELDGINPATQDLSQLKARVILLHGRGDNMIPYTESMALARALAPGQVRLFIIDGFAHVDIKPGDQDIPALLAAIQALLEQRVR